MNLPEVIALSAAGLLVARWAVELGLEWLNRRHVIAHAGEVPAAFKEVIDPATYAKSVDYTLARSRLGLIRDTYDLLLTLVVLFSGLLPWAFYRHVADSAWGSAAFLLGVGLALMLTGLPLDWHDQFKLEERFGFNTTTVGTWCFDQVKGVLLSVAIGYPLLVLILKLVEWTGDRWWLWAWVCVLVFQVLMMVLAPVLILPLFNKFTPLAEGSLRDRLLALAQRTRFRAQSIQVMDGSKRSRHSNAFFTGFGRFRKIVLYDTLIGQLTEPELEAVLAHEIGHWRLKHVPKMLVWSVLSLLPN